MKKLTWTLLCAVLLLPCVYAEEPDIIYVDGKPVYIEGVLNPLEKKQKTPAQPNAAVPAPEVQGDIYRGHILGAPSPERNNEGGDIYRGTVFGQKAPSATEQTVNPNDAPKTKLLYDTPLMRAIKIGDADRVRYLIYSNMDANERNYAGMTPLTVAAEKDNYEIVRLLVEDGGALVNTTSSYGITPLIAAAAGGHRESVELLLKNGAEANVKDDMGRTPLLHAMRTNDRKMAEALAASYPQAINMPDNSGNSPLIYAAQKGNTDNVNVLLKYEVNVDYQNPTNGVSALIAASANGHDKTAKALIAGEATLDLRDKLGRTALFYAARNGQYNLVRQFIKEGANIDALDKNGENLLMAAAESQTPRLLNYLTPQYFFIDTADRAGKTALMYSTQKGTKALQWLINKGADLDLRDANGDTALMHAIKNNNNSAALLLLREGADITAVNKQNKNALQLAQEVMPNSPVVIELQEIRAEEGFQRPQAYQTAPRAVAAPKQQTSDEEIAALQRQLDEAKARRAKQLKSAY